MKESATLFLRIALLIWLAAGSRPVGAQSANQIFGPPTGDPPARMFPGITTDDSGFGNLLHSFGIGSSIEEARAAAAADGMKLLAQLMEKNGYDRQQAWIAFYGSPEGQRIMRVPGALSLLTDWFNATMALSSRAHPPITSGRVGPEGKSSFQPADQAAGGEVAGTLTPPFLGPYRPNAYGPGINSDAAGRPFVWQPDNAPADPLARVRSDVFGPGIGMDQYGRPVHAACPPFQQTC